MFRNNVRAALKQSAKRKAKGKWLKSNTHTHAHTHAHIMKHTHVCSAIFLAGKYFCLLEKYLTQWPLMALAAGEISFKIDFFVVLFWIYFFLFYFKHMKR